MKCPVFHQKDEVSPGRPDDTHGDSVPEEEKGLAICVEFTCSTWFIMSHWLKWMIADPEVM